MCAQDGQTNESNDGQTVSTLDLDSAQATNAQGLSPEQHDANIAREIQQLRSNGYYARVNYQLDQTQASTEFTKMLPNGYETLETSGRDLLCGLTAVILSLYALHQIDDKIPVATLEML